MSEQPPTSHLEPPQKSVELEDSGAQESASNSDDEEHFSDASEGRPRTTSSPVPRTRVEKVDDNPSHGEVPGTSAYDKRGEDSVPDEIEVIPEGSRSRSQSMAESHNHPANPEEPPVPRTMVERVEPERPSHGDIPGTAAYEQRKADAVPDLVMTAPESGGTSEPSPESSDGSGTSTAMPETLVSQVESTPSEETESRPHAHRRKASDSLPDSTEVVPDAPGKRHGPSLSSRMPKERLTNSDPQSLLELSPEHSEHAAAASPMTEDDKQKMRNSNDVDDVDDTTTTIPGALPDDEPPMDDFDDFAEEQGDMGDDDFGDFDDGFQEPTEEVAEVEGMDQGTAIPSQAQALPPVPPLLDLDTITSLPDLTTTLKNPLDRLFPTTKETPSLPPVEPIQNDAAIFHTDRSLSLWSQLVAPPPLQPQNWVKSRIRRLFLVSLGVPVDLDEILPASKQKKLVLPQHTTTTTPSQQDTTSSTATPATEGKTIPPPSAQQQRQSYSSRRREPTPPPALDLSAVHRLCTTTDAALTGLTDGELHAHVSELQDVTQRAGKVLEYWVKRLDGLVGEKEAFEGVIENLVSHARRVRK